MSYTPITAQQIKDRSIAVKPFWQLVFEAQGVTSPYFSLKISFRTDDFATPQMAARCFPFELAMTSYFELSDFNFTPLEPEYRRLHRLPFRADYKTRYPFISSAQGGAYLVPLSEFELVHSEPNVVKTPLVMPEITSSPFELSASGKAKMQVIQPAIQPELAPEPQPQPERVQSFMPPHYETASTVTSSPINATGFEPDTEETVQPSGLLDDAEMSTLTARDSYALTHSVPCSNKQWINDMVNFGNAYRRDLGNRLAD